MPPLRTPAPVRPERYKPVSFLRLLSRMFVRALFGSGRSGGGCVEHGSSGSSSAGTRRQAAFREHVNGKVYRDSHDALLLVHPAVAFQGFLFGVADAIEVTRFIR